MTTVMVADLVGPNCLTVEDGARVYPLLSAQLKAGLDVEVDFLGVQVFASPFFNAAVGRLLRDHTEAEIGERIQFRNLPDVGVHILKRVIENSAEYYNDPNVGEAVDRVLEEMGVDDGC